jgi:endothelin-converting enzyme/putative endopeptidase
VGYPDKWKDYSRVVITRNSYFDDVMAAAQFVINDDRSTIGKPVDRGRWGMTPPTSNAYYNPLLNEIVFPAGILQPPAFSVKATDAVNYGAIGVVIGHEISHGFDDQGAQYDSIGRLSNWWTADDLKKFQAKTACVMKQSGQIAEHSSQRQAGAGRIHRRSGRSQDCLPGVPEVTAGQACGAGP